MNRIPGMRIHPVSIAVLLLIGAFGVAAADPDSAQPTTGRVYGADYRITPDTSREGARIQLSIAQSGGARSKLQTLGKSAASLCKDRSTGPVTTRAAGVLTRLNDEIRRKTD